MKIEAMEIKAIDHGEKADTASMAASAVADVIQRERLLLRLRLLRFGGGHHRRGVVEGSGECNDFYVPQEFHHYNRHGNVVIFQLCTLTGRNTYKLQTDQLLCRRISYHPPVPYKQTTLSVAF